MFLHSWEKKKAYRRKWLSFVPKDNKYKFGLSIFCPYFLSFVPQKSLWNIYGGCWFLWMSILSRGSSQCCRSRRRHWKTPQAPFRLYSIEWMPGVLQQVHLPLFHIHHFQSSQQGMSFIMQIFELFFLKAVRTTNSE